MRVRGSTVIIVVMFLSCVAYMVAQVYVKQLTGEWFPSEVTVMAGAIFITELGCLAKIRMTKEGVTPKEAKIIANHANSRLDELGAGGSVFSDVLEEAIEESNGKHARSEQP